MNHLAHIYLSFNSEELLFGNFLADFLTLREKKMLEESAYTGIRLHRWIDEYTDNHPIIAEWKQRMYPHFGKYSPVLTDILMDHQLAIHWPILRDDPFDAFCEDSYRTIRGFFPLVNEGLQSRLDRMIQASWLHTFQNLEGLRETLRLLALRAKFADDFSGFIDYYQQHKLYLDIGFMEFFPELTAYAKLRLEELNLRSGD